MFSGIILFGERKNVDLTMHRCGQHGVGFELGFSDATKSIEEMW